MNQFICGISAGLSLVVALFFLKYWRETRERLFASFAAGFLVLSVHWAQLQGKARPYVFALRLVAFGLIILGILSKNQRARHQG